MPNFPRMHVSLYVANVEATTQFYTQLFGAEPSKRREGYVKWNLENPALIISFVQNPDKVQAKFGHLGFQLETLEELKQRRATAVAAGLPVRDELGVNCCYANADKAWVTDPDGYEWELYYFHEDVEFNDPHYTLNASEAGQCCINTTTSETPAAKPKVNLRELATAPVVTAGVGECCAPGSGCC